MEMYLWELLLCQRKCIARIGKKDISTVLIQCHIGMFAALEVGELFGVIALDPAGLMDRDWLPATLCAILVFEAVFDNLELQGADGADNLTAIE